MSADLQLFKFEHQPVRVVLVDGEPWFVLADLCRALGIANVGNAAARLDADVKGVHQADTPGGRQSVTIVSESGMYEIVIRSDKKEAARFRRWVTHKVLPEIRRTGSYSHMPAAPVALPSKKELAQWVVEAEERAEAAEAQVRELTPPAAAWNELAESQGDYSVADAAKVLARDPQISTGERRLFQSMAGFGWIFRREGRWRAYQAQVDTGRLVEKVGRPYPERRRRDRGARADHPHHPKGLGRTAPEARWQWATRTRGGSLMITPLIRFPLAIIGHVVDKLLVASDSRVQKFAAAIGTRPEQHLVAAEAETEVHEPPVSPICILDNGMVEVDTAWLDSLPKGPQPSEPCGEWRFTASELELLGLEPGDHLGNGVVGPAIQSAFSVFHPIDPAAPGAADPSCPTSPLGCDVDPVGAGEPPASAPAGSPTTEHLLRAAAAWIANQIREDASGEPWTLTRTLLNELISRADELAAPTP